MDLTEAEDIKNTWLWAAAQVMASPAWICQSSFPLLSLGELSSSIPFLPLLLPLPQQRLELANFPSVIKGKPITSYPTCRYVCFTGCGRSYRF